MTKDFTDLDWTAAKAENARLRERERALIDELTEARREIGERVLERTALLEKVKRAEEMRQAFDTESQVVFSRARKAEDELAEANAAHDDAETRADAALLDLRIANEALATFNARVLGLEAELAEARRDAAASLSQRADLVEELAEARRRNDELLQRWTGRAMEDVCPKCNHVMLQYAVKGLNSVDCAVCEAQAKIASLKAQVGSGVAALTALNAEKQR